MYFDLELHLPHVIIPLFLQKVISVASQDIIRRTAYLGQIAVNLVETCSDGDGDSDTAVKRRVAEVVDDLLDKSSVLSVSASLLSPLLAHPSCQDGLMEVVKMVADAAEKTGVLTQVCITLSRVPVLINLSVIQMGTLNHTAVWVLYSSVTFCTISGYCAITGIVQ